MLLVPDFASISDSVVSSTYLCVMHEACRLLTKVMNVSGPTYDPCGMPAFITRTYECSLFSSLMLIVRKLTA